jgi:hypothetical protein
VTAETETHGETAVESQDDLADVVAGDFNGGASADSEDDEPEAEVALYDERPHDERSYDERSYDEPTAETDTDDDVAAEADNEDEYVAEAAPEYADEPSEEPAAQVDEDEDDDLAPVAEDAPAEPDDVPLAPVAMASVPEAPAAVAEEPFGQVITPEVPARLMIRRPLSAAPAASALEGELVEDPNEEENSPIFGSLQSNWLSDENGGEAWTDPAVDAGWTAAKVVEALDDSARTPTGLPVRRPGGRLVPGGVGSMSSPEPVSAVRDPEAIRNRLASHAAGVSRGRAAAAAQPMTDDYAHEETGPA